MNQYKEKYTENYHERRLLHPIVKFSLKSRIRAIADAIMTCPPNIGPDVKLESGLNTGGANGQEELHSRISAEDKLITRFSKKYVRNLFRNKAEIIYQGTSGVILPNKTPMSLLPLCKTFEPVIFPKLYHLAIAIKKMSVQKNESNL